MHYGQVAQWCRTPTMSLKTSKESLIQQIFLGSVWNTEIDFGMGVGTIYASLQVIYSAHGVSKANEPRTEQNAEASSGVERNISSIGLIIEREYISMMVDACISYSMTASQANCLTSWGGRGSSSCASAYRRLAAKSCLLRRLALRATKITNVTIRKVGVPTNPIVTLPGCVRVVVVVSGLFSWCLLWSSKQMSTVRHSEFSSVFLAQKLRT